MGRAIAYTLHTGVRHCGGSVGSQIPDALINDYGVITNLTEAREVTRSLNIIALDD